MFFPHIIRASFQFSVNEAAATCPRFTRSIHTKAYIRRRRAAATGLLSLPQEDIEMPSAEDEEELGAPRASKRVCRRVVTTREATATALWWGSVIDQVLDQEEKNMEVLASHFSAAVSLSGYGVDLYSEVNDCFHAKLARMIDELRPGSRPFSRKRSFGNI